MVTQATQATQATAEEIKQLFTMEQFERKRIRAAAVQRGRQIENRGFLVSVFGGIAGISGVVYGLLVLSVWSGELEPRFFLTFIPAGALVVIGSAMEFVGSHLPRYSRQNLPLPIFVLLTCPECGQEHPEQEFERRSVRVSYE